MLRWLIAFLILANLLMLAVVQGMFGPLPAAGAAVSSAISTSSAPAETRKWYVPRYTSALTTLSHGFLAANPVLPDRLLQ